MTPLSAVLITLDEERNLAEALASVSFCDELVVVDAGSRDRTCAIAAAAGARVITNTPWPGFVAQRRCAVQAATHDWVLALDADERVTPALRDEIQARREQGFDAAAYRIPRVAFYLGRWIRATDWYPDPQVRLFDRRRGRWEGGLVHESVKVEGTLGRLRGDLEHHPYRDISDHMHKVDRYTTLWAEQAALDGRCAGALAMMLAGQWAFLRNYVFKGGFRLGRTGLIVSLLNAYYTFAKLAKLAEIARTQRSHA